MREKLKWGVASYDILLKGEVSYSARGTACFSHFMNRFKDPYDTIRLFDIDCKLTFEFRSFYLQYVIDMFDLKEASFNDEYFEFKSQGILYKDAAVMTVIRFLWENIGGQDLDTVSLFFRPLRDDELEFEDKLERFCFCYKNIDPNGEKYFSEGHSWQPKFTQIKSTEMFKEYKNWKSVNLFFSQP